MFAQRRAEDDDSMSYWIKVLRFECGRTLNQILELCGGAWARSVFVKIISIIYASFFCTVKYW